MWRTARSGERSGIRSEPDGIRSQLAVNFAPDVLVASDANQQKGRQEKPQGRTAARVIKEHAEARTK